MRFYILFAAIFLMITFCGIARAEEIVTQQIVTTTAPPPPVTVVTTAKPYCREYTQKLTIAGKTQTGYGTACLQPDGSWELRPADKKVVVATPAGETITTVQTIRYVTRGERVYVIPPQPYVAVASAPVVEVIEQPPVVEVIGGHHRHWH